MDLSTVGDAGRAEGKFPAADCSPGNRDWDAGPVSDAAMIKKIGGVGSEIVGVENPASEGDTDPELMFFIAFAVECDETTIHGAAELKQRAGNRY